MNYNKINTIYNDRLYSQVSGYNKYIYKTFVFELVLKDLNKNINIIRKVSKYNKGTILSCNDSILFSNIDKLELTILDINTSKSTIIKKNLNKINNNYVFYYNYIFLEINNINNNININYIINK